MFPTACNVELTGLLVQRKEMEAHRAGDYQGHADAEDDSGMMVVMKMGMRIGMRIGMRHTLYLSFFLHRQNFWKIKFTRNLHSKLPIYTVN